MNTGERHHLVVHVQVVIEVAHFVEVRLAVRVLADHHLVRAAAQGVDLHDSVVLAEGFELQNLEAFKMGSVVLQKVDVGLCRVLLDPEHRLDHRQLFFNDAWCFVQLGHLTAIEAVIRLLAASCARPLLTGQYLVIKCRVRHIHEHCTNFYLPRYEKLPGPIKSERR